MSQPEIESVAIPGAEFMALEDIAVLQRDRWRVQAAYVSQNSTFYREHFADQGLVGDIAELADLPFTDKEMLRTDQKACPPFGTYQTAAPEKLSRIHRTSGTTGAAMNLALTARDAVMTAKVGARAQMAAGLGPGHVVVHCLNYQLWMGGFTDHASLEETGATVVPYGVGGTQGLVRTIQELGVTAISCTPSYPAVLERAIAEHFPRLQPRDLGLKLGLFGGESGLDDPAFRDRLETTWGIAARNANYGVTDILCNFAGQTEICSDLHFVASDVLFAELIDPDSTATKPWREGENGELVLTHLAKECQPLVRFRTGDIISVTGTGPAACGRTATRFRVVGRSDDMVVVRGLNMFPTMVGEVLNRFSEVSGEYRIVLSSPPPHDFLPISAELAEGCQDRPELAAAIEQAIKTFLGATAKVALLPPLSLPRTEGKTKRVERTY
jgi:phenylacetate-CoA ligase